MNAGDIARLGFVDGQQVRATTVARDGEPREVGGLRLVRYDIPPGCAAGYFPELNPLVPLWHHAVGSQVPAYKAIPIRLSRTRGLSLRQPTASVQIETSGNATLPASNARGVNIDRIAAV